jgi:acid phosphatase (class A)
MLDKKELLFGNPNRRFYLLKKQEGYLDSLLTELESYPPPSNDSPEVQNEIHELIDFVNGISFDTEFQKKLNYFDSNFEEYIIKALSSQGINEHEVRTILTDIHDDVIPIIVKLKFKYQRIRPSALAVYYGLPLYPFESKTSDSPAYPSGHTIQSMIYCEVLGNKYPKYYKALMEVAKEITLSRLYMGLHYASDCDFGGYVAELIMKHPDFRKKYKL